MNLAISVAHGLLVFREKYAQDLEVGDKLLRDERVVEVGEIHLPSKGEADQETVSISYGSRNQAGTFHRHRYDSMLVLVGIDA